MPDSAGNPLPTEPGYLAPNTGLLAVGTAAPGGTVAGYNPSAATATPATASTYDPSKFVVTPEQTVEGRTANLVKDDSVLMQQARVRANQDAQAKGLLSSSLAVGAGQNAVIQNALPIASQDAATFNKAMTDTANAQNTAKQYNAGITTDVSKVNAGLLTNVSQTNTDAQNAAKTLSASGFNTQMLANIDNTTKIALANLTSQNSQLLQTNANANQMFQETVKNIAGIAVDATLSQAAKDAATQTQMNLLNEGLRTTAGVASTAPAEVKSLNLGQYFNTDPSSMTTAQKVQQLSQLQNALTAAGGAIEDARGGGKSPTEILAEEVKWNQAYRALNNFKAQFPEAVTGAAA